MGCSFITNQTQIGPKTVSNIKNNCTSCAGIYLGAKVRKVNGRNTQKKHIKKIRYISKPTKLISCKKKNAVVAIKNLANNNEGKKLLIFPYLIITELEPTKKAVAKAIISPNNLPPSYES